MSPILALLVTQVVQQPAVVTPEPISQQGLLEPFLKYVLPLLLTGISVLVGMALAAMSARAKAQADKDIASHKTISVGAFLFRMTELARSAYLTVEQTMKPKIVAAAVDGTITAAEAQALKDEAVSLLKAWAGENAKAEAAAFLGLIGSSFESWLGGLIESQVATGGGVVGTGTAGTGPVVVVP